MADEKHMRQQTLSNMLESQGVYVCRDSISRIEDYSRTVTDMELCAIATVLGVTPDQLLEYKV